VSAAAAPAAVPALGVLQIAVSPWGEVEVDGRPVGITPPLVKLELAQGSHQLTVRNGDFPPFTVQVEVHPDQPAVVKHRFGS
jgi:serine/threonine-protein kinase